MKIDRALLPALGLLLSLSSAAIAVTPACPLEGTRYSGSADGKMGGCTQYAKDAPCWLKGSTHPNGVWEGAPLRCVKMSCTNTQCGPNWIFKDGKCQPCAGERYFFGSSCKGSCSAIGEPCFLPSGVKNGTVLKTADGAVCRDTRAAAAGQP